MGFLAGIGSVLGGLGGLFGSSKPKQTDVSKTLMQQAKGARQAAAEYGFNPLTMLQYGQPGAGALYGGGGTPPLASVEAITGGLESVAGEFNGEAERQRKADELNMDLAKVKLDQARAELKNLESPLGRRAVTVNNGGAVHTRALSMAPPAPAPAAQASVSGARDENAIAPDRQVQRAPLSNSPGVFELDNALTYGPVTIPGDGEPWGIDELGTAVVVGGPQVVKNYATKYGEDARNWDDLSDEEKEKSPVTQMKRTTRPARVFGGGAAGTLGTIFNILN